MRVCLAGTSGICKCNRKYMSDSKYLLESYYYIQEWQIPLIKQCDLFLLDSGAFTFLNNFKGEINWQEYVDKYADFIVKNDVKYFFELDIDPIVGHEKVKELRKYLENKTQRKSIPVWHKSRGLDEWIRLTKEYDYVAIGGVVIKEIKQTEYKFFTQLLKIAKENNCKVHGLGFTRLKLLPKYPFYSVDSTSWVSGERFGQIYEFKNNQLYMHYRPEGSRVKTADGWRAKIEKHNFEQWIKYQKFMNKYY